MNPTVESSAPAAAGVPPHPSRPKGMKTDRLAAALMLLGYAALCISGSRVKSATNDEPAYISASDFYWHTGEYRVKRDAPPLVPFLVGGLLRLHGAGLCSDPDAAPRINAQMQQFDVGWQYFAVFESGSIRILRIARLVPTACGVLLGLMLFLRAGAAFGRTGALLALGLYCTDPNMIAHGRTVSADLPLAAAFFGCHFAFASLSGAGRSRRSPARLIAFGLMIALGLMTKFSAPLILISLAVLVSGELVSDRGRRAATLRETLIVALAAFAGFLVLTVALYRDARGPLLYLEGIGLLYDNLVPDYFYYLNGEFRQGSWWYYHIEAAVLKTPVAVLLLFALSLLPLQGNRGRSAELPSLLVPIAVIHLAGALDPGSFGLRRVLAAGPFMFLIIGRLGRLLERDADGAATPPLIRARRVSIGALAAWGVASALSIHPNQLSYFNFIAGGPSGGHRFLDDSNLDWGQDLPALSRYMRDHSTGPVVLGYSGNDLPWNYGIEHRRMELSDFAFPEPGVHAVSVHLLIRQRLRSNLSGDPDLDWLSRFEPVTVLNHTMYVYDFREKEPSP